MDYHHTHHTWHTPSDLVPAIGWETHATLPLYFAQSVPGLKQVAPIVYTKEASGSPTPVIYSEVTAFAIANGYNIICHSGHACFYYRGPDDPDPQYYNRDTVSSHDAFVDAGGLWICAMGYTSLNPYRPELNPLPGTTWRVQSPRLWSAINIASHPIYYTELLNPTLPPEYYEAHAGWGFPSLELITGWRDSYNPEFLTGNIATLCAYIWEANPTYNNWDVRQHLRQTCAGYRNLKWRGSAGFGMAIPYTDFDYILGPGGDVTTGHFENLFLNHPKLALGEPLDAAPPVDIRYTVDVAQQIVTLKWKKFAQTGFVSTRVKLDDGTIIYEGAGETCTWHSDREGSVTFQFHTVLSGNVQSREEEISRLTINNLLPYNIGADSFVVCRMMDSKGSPRTGLSVVFYLIEADSEGTEVRDSFPITAEVNASGWLQNLNHTNKVSLRGGRYRVVVAYREDEFTINVPYGGGNYELTRLIEQSIAL